MRWTAKKKARQGDIRTQRVFSIRPRECSSGHVHWLENVWEKQEYTYSYSKLYWDTKYIICPLTYNHATETVRTMLEAGKQQGGGKSKERTAAEEAVAHEESFQSQLNDVIKRRQDLSARLQQQVFHPYGLQQAALAAQQQHAQHVGLAAQLQQDLKGLQGLQGAIQPQKGDGDAD